ncbi:hypothetical protein DFH07DRAFT_781730 [Mycena maculata]|uniref:Uncharacterized protein n=1 Tax=Mycena maculata TaxID=230809 RepID=A0AAD7HY75_9AGAR|nr:hypothetical protein DFH07DRAFT_781730 [Mycena maculata]
MYLISQYRMVCHMTIGFPLKVTISVRPVSSTSTSHRLALPTPTSRISPLLSPRPPVFTVLSCTVTSLGTSAALLVLVLLALSWVVGTSLVWTDPSESESRRPLNAVIASEINVLTTLKQNAPKSPLVHSPTRFPVNPQEYHPIDLMSMRVILAPEGPGAMLHASRPGDGKDGHCIIADNNLCHSRQNVEEGCWVKRPVETPPPEMVTSGFFLWVPLANSAGGASGSEPPFTVIWYPPANRSHVQWNTRMEPKVLNADNPVFHGPDCYHHIPPYLVEHVQEISPEPTMGKLFVHEMNWRDHVVGIVAP